MKTLFSSFSFFNVSAFSIAEDGSENLFSEEIFTNTSTNLTKIVRK
ncbi:hypothetical protein [Aequorivita marisscotiae]|uniref:Uncharacterized protein n=1 Tax=Aequorivita marisscotiae TaxID=3040348 RepID=A0ABY8KWQ1_9FLAO|nr:hypothetical protein [Aequorivita sp. Ant34-E75]WGF92605.1 hypothetical protein QCQ61_00050 [Aequorivita sp. Ant34-E75]